MTLRVKGAITKVIQNQLSYTELGMLYQRYEQLQRIKLEVQCMAGHKYISSTEKYAAREMGSLTDQLVKHHPFG